MSANWDWDKTLYPAHVLELLHLFSGDCFIDHLLPCPPVDLHLEYDSYANCIDSYCEGFLRHSLAFLNSKGGVFVGGLSLCDEPNSIRLSGVKLTQSGKTELQLRLVQLLQQVSFFSNNQKLRRSSLVLGEHIHLEFIPLRSQSAQNSDSDDDDLQLLMSSTSRYLVVSRVVVHKSCPEQYLVYHNNIFERNGGTTSMNRLKHAINTASYDSHFKTTDGSIDFPRILREKPFLNLPILNSHILYLFTQKPKIFCLQLKIFK
ncbi:hypothetical protein GEMRC1_012089 [Eukaryota sp. GEM-RC1]